MSKHNHLRFCIIRAALACALALPAGCISLKGDPKLFIFSDPPGATIHVDGEDSGFTTPAVLEPSASVITISKDGYAPQSRRVRRKIHFRYPRWNDGGTADYSLAVSVFRTADDFFFPLQFSMFTEPRRIFVRLQPLDAQAAAPPPASKQ